MAKINKEETMARMLAAAPTDEELANTEAVSPESLDDRDLILCTGALLELCCRGTEVNLDEFLNEIRRRSRQYTMEMLQKENLLVMEGE